MAWPMPGLPQALRMDYRRSFHEPPPLHRAALIAAGGADGGADSSAAAMAVAEEDAVRVALEPALYEALQGMDVSPEERARELIVLGLFREGRMTAGRAAWHLGLSEQEFTDLLTYKGISQT